MNIYYISNTRIPTQKAHGYQIIKMCEAFVYSGQNCKLFLPTRRQLNKTDIFNHYNIRARFIVKKIRCFDPRFLLKLPSGIYIKFQSFFFVTALFFKLLFDKKRDKETVFYTRDEYVLPILQFFSNNVIWEAHNIPRHHNVYYKYWNKCSKIIAISNSLKEVLVEFGISPKKILVSPDGVDLEEFQINQTRDQIRRKLGLPLDKKIIIYTGNFYKWKGVDLLALASKKINDNSIFVFVGGSKSRVNQFKSCYDSSNLLILGNKPHGTIPQYLKSADVLVIPNSAKKKISSQFTSPLKLFEYMASGVPIIASNISSIREILLPSECFFFEPDNSDSLASAIESVFQNYPEAISRGRDAQKKVQNYTWKKRASNIVNFIK